MKVSIPFLLVIIMIAPTITKADYNVAIGNTFTFDVIKSNWDITYGTDTSFGEGFAFEEETYIEKTQFTVLVTDASISDVDWNMTIGSITEEGTNNPSDLGVITLYLFFPLFFGNYSGGWNQTEMDLGPQILPIFFVDITEFSEFFFLMANDTFVSECFYGTDWTISNMDGSFDNSSAIAVFEWHFDMTFTNAVSGHNYGGTFTMIFVFDKVTGAIKGYYLNVNYSGQMDFTAVTAILEQRVEQVGYNLPGVGFIPGFEWFMVIPAFALIIGLPIILKRRK